MDDTSLFALPAGFIVGGRYQVQRVLGMGGFAITYQAYDTVLCGTVAIKEYFPQSCAERALYKAKVLTRTGKQRKRFQEGLTRFKQEATRTAELQGRHNVVDVYGLCEENGTAYMIMEYLEGITLDEYLALLPDGRFLNVDDAAQIASAVAEALAYIHSHNMLHRDVSPDNIFLCSNGGVKLIDFGAAQESATDSERSVIVKAGYTPPEQYNRSGKQGPWTDIYALGATLYCMLARRFPDAAPDRQSYGADELKPPSAENSAVPEYLDVLVMRCLALDSRLRINSAAEIQKILYQHKTVYTVDEVIARRRMKRAVISIAITTVAILLAVTGIVFYTKTDSLYSVVLSACKLNVELPEQFSSSEGLAALEQEFEMQYPMVDLHLICQGKSEAEENPAIFPSTGNSQGCAPLDKIRELLPEGELYAQRIAYAPTLLYGNSVKAVQSHISATVFSSAESIPSDAITESYDEFIDLNNGFYVYRGSLSEYTEIQQQLSGLYTVCLDPASPTAPVSLCIADGLSIAEENAAMRFLLYLTSERAQEILFLDHHGMLPANQAAYDRFFEIYRELDFLQEKYGR